MRKRCRDCGQPSVVVGKLVDLAQGDFCRACLAEAVAQRDELLGARVKLDITASVRGSSGDELTWESLEKCVERITITANGETQTWPIEELNPSPNGKEPSR